MRVLCVIPAMAAPGGAERVMSFLIAHLSKQHSVTLLTFEGPDATSFYPLPKSVSCNRINSLGNRGLKRVWDIIKRPKLIRREVRRLVPDVVISFMDTTNIMALLGCQGLKIPVVISERVDPNEHRIGWLKTTARDRTYPFARLIVVQTRRIAGYFPAHLQPKIRIIANPVPAAPVTAQPDIPDSKGRKRAIAVGRLEAQKGFEQLIDAFALVADGRNDWDLAVIGEGPERPSLECQIRRYGLESRIKLMGRVPDIFRELAASHLMAFPSVYEGFPNALAEGLAAGLPAVGNLGVSGVDELIVNGRTGFLVDGREGPVGFARALTTLMDNAPCRARFGEAARRHVLRWSPDQIFDRWDEILAEATAARAMRPKTPMKASRAGYDQRPGGS
jgi:glycosyltransferase involved in cell wall biosynthesis